MHGGRGQSHSKVYVHPEQSIRTGSYIQCQQERALMTQFVVLSELESIEKQQQ